MHDVVGVAQKVTFSRKPFLWDVDGPDVTSNDGQQVLKNDSEGGVRGSTPKRAQSQRQTANADEEGCGRQQMRMRKGAENAKRRPHTVDTVIAW